MAIRRVAGRVLPVSPQGEVLLIQCQDPARPGEAHWVSIGGAVEPGETTEQAAVRELAEETGIAASVDRLTEIHRRDQPFSWDGVEYVNDSTFYAMALRRDTTVHFDDLEPGEVGNVLDADWWLPEALRDDGTAASGDLPDIMASAIVIVRGTS